jgi:hypothetical protein
MYMSRAKKEGRQNVVRQLILMKFGGRIEPIKKLHYPKLYRPKFTKLPTLQGAQSF